MYSNLVLSGGAIKSVSLLGAIKYLEEKNLIKNFKNYIGTSGGAIILFFLLIGYSSNDIKNILLNELDFLTNLNIQNITNIYYELGIDNTKKNEKILRKYLYSKSNLESITFIEFCKKYGYNLIITGANITTQSLDYFSIDTFPDMDIIQALLITSCIPILYKPILFNDNLYIDGGIYSNFPLDYFEKYYNETIGISVITNYKKDNNNIINYMSNILFSVMTKLSYDNIERNKDKYNICYIDFEDSVLNDINFSLDDLEMKIDKNNVNKYYEIGYKKFKNYYEN